MLEINDLKFGYRKHEVFNNLNMSFPEGKIYGLLGQNGAGKSTLLYLASGLLFAEKGDVKFDGKKVAKRTPDILSEIFIVPEEFDLPRMSFKRYVKLYSTFYPNFSNSILEKCLAGFDMTMDINLGRLSMGQKKKAYVCFALATNTKLLLMDEPTNGLDIPSKSQFRKVVAECMTDERTIIISTHQVRDVENLLDQIIILNNKQIALDAPIAKVIETVAFCERKNSESLENAIYSQPTPWGNMTVEPKAPDQPETPLNIELLFGAFLTEEEKMKQLFK